MYTSREVAEMLNLSFHSIRNYCRRYNIGTRKGPIWILNDSDVAVIKSRMGKAGHKLSK